MATGCRRPAPERSMVVTTTPSLQGGPAVLRPQDTATRERKSLNGLWRFAWDPAGAGRADRWFAGPLTDAREMAVPASFNDIVADPAVRDYFGDVWYQRMVWVPRDWEGQRI